MESNQSITAEYFQITKEYQKKYGKNTILLMQVGAFFEVYGLKNVQTGEVKGSEIVDFSQVCQLNVSEKKAYVNGDVIVMAGFRDYTLEKYIQKLSENGYTAVVYVQEKDGKNVTRKFHSVYSAGTYIAYDNDSSPQQSNNIMCIWIEKYKPFVQTMNENIVCGISTANIFTGKSTIFEYQIPFYDNPTTFDELERYVSTYGPSEILFISPFDERMTERVIQYTGMHTTHIHKYYTNPECENLSKNADILKNCSQQKYIQHILTTFFGEESYQLCNEFNNHEVATQSFCYLLHFIQEHNPNLVRKIEQPVFNNTSSRMILANHTLKQLNIINESVEKHGKYSSVLSFLNKCCTPMGKREFKIQLTNPNFDCEWLNQEYEMTALLLNESNVHFIPLFRKQLVQIRDIEKICRQLVLNKIYPSSIYHLYQSIGIIQQLYVCLLESPEFNQYFEKSLKKGNLGSQFSQIQEFINQKIILEVCKDIQSVQTFDQNFIQKGVSLKLDEIIEKYETSLNTFHMIRDKLNGLIRNYENSPETDYIKIHETDKSGFSFQITKKRGLTLKTILSKLSGPIQITEQIQIAPKDISLKNASTTNDEIEIPILHKICKDIFIFKEVIHLEIAIAYNDFLKDLESNWLFALENMATYVAKMDILQTKAYIAMEYKYTRPVIVNDPTHSSSFVEAYELRHCLIEHIQQNEIYVPNDIILGESVNTKKGVLLYGTNAVGKTSLIRALGISIIMAQSGLYVPCSKFVYKPYTAIYSRILGNDNLFKGLSTFAVEMSELRMILRGADENSLILGDELCSGTETESALSIFMAGLMHLHEKRSSYIFATHFHEILHYDELRTINTLSVKHMAVEFDREHDCLIYDRKLRDGPGNKMYGLEVCKSLYLPDDFLENAYSIRNKYYPVNQGELAHGPSTYNAKKIRGICEICKLEMGEEVHHLSPQKDADENGFIGSFHKNHLANLLTVCEKCHHQLHSKSSNKIVRKKSTKGYIVKAENG